MPADAKIIFFEELRRSMRRKAYVIITLAMPVLLLVILTAVPVIRALAQGDEDEEEPKPIRLVNLSRDLDFGSDALPGFELYPTPKRATDALIAEEVREVFIFPVDYLETGIVEWRHTGGGLLSGFDAGPGSESSAIIRNLVRAALASDDLTQDLLIRALAPAAFERTRVGSDGLPVEERDEGAALVAGFASSILLMFSIIFSASVLVQAVAEDKENRMIEVLLTSTRPLWLLAGKVVAVGLAGLLTVSVWVASIVAIVPLIFDAIPDAPDLALDPIVLFWVVVYFVSGYFVAAVILAGIGAASSSVREATQLSVIVVMPMAAPFYALVEIITHPNGLLSRILTFIPLTAPMTMILRVSVEEPSPLEIVGSLAIIVLTGIGLLWVSARMFRAAMLMYGQRMSLSGLMAALREAG